MHLSRSSKVAPADSVPPEAVFTKPSLPPQPQVNLKQYTPSQVPQEQQAMSPRRPDVSSPLPPITPRSAQAVPISVQLPPSIDEQPPAPAVEAAAAPFTQPLPAGWQAVVDEASGRTYYVGDDGQTSWTQPTVEVRAGGTPALPAGWRAAVDQASGRTYYVGDDGQTSWTPPSVEAAPPVSSSLVARAALRPLEVATPRDGEVVPPQPRTHALDHMRVFVGTWNLHGCDPGDAEDLSKWLGDPGSGGAPDIFAIGSQEAERSIQASVLNTSKAKWMASLQTALGGGYVCIGSQTLVAIHLAIFVKVHLLSAISGVQQAHVATGLAGTLGNKGGVAIALNVAKTSMLFVNAHFAAHQKNVAHRNADFHRIDSQLRLTPMVVDSPVTVLPDAGGVPRSAPAVPMSAPVKLSSAPSAFPPPMSMGSSLPQSAVAPPDASTAPPSPPPSPGSKVAPAPPAGLDDADENAIEAMVRRSIAARDAYDSDEGDADAAADAATPAAPSKALASCSSRFDRAFFFGDLNYRINGSREAIDSLLAPADEATRQADEWGGDEAHWERMRAVLLANDQLRVAMHQRAAFSGWAEGAIAFRPTYKFDKRRRDEYDMSEKRRIPAYTDRVLWKPPPPSWPHAKPVPLPETGGSALGGVAACDVRLVRYESVPALLSSDHKPVLAEFDVRVDGLSVGSDGQARASVRARHAMARSGSRTDVKAHTPRPRSADSKAAQSALCAVM